MVVSKVVSCSKANRRDLVGTKGWSFEVSSLLYGRRQVIRVIESIELRRPSIRKQDLLITMPVCDPIIVSRRAH